MERRRINKLATSKEVAKLAKQIGAGTWDSEDLISEIKILADTGCTELNAALNGGFPYKRIVNIIGDSSTGKSLLATDCIANEQKKNNAIVIVDDPEGTNEKINAESQGVNVSDVIYQDPPSNTVEEFFKRILDLCDKNFDRPLIYILDSLDSLSSDREIDSEIEESGFAKKLGKANTMSEGLRRICRKIAEKEILLIIISQTRVKIGVTFGDKWTVTGGKALEFYCTQRILLAKLKKVIDKNKAVTGQRIKFKVIKNKIGIPFKQGEFDILFGYGIDDIGSMADYLKENLYKTTGFQWEGVKISSREKFVGFIEENNFEENLRILVKETWKVKNEPQINRKPKK